ncbi:hypothetical protein [Blastococcus sp. VKM Ac-2987]|uniref:hypothetical protein n=1 Tax=Blastococcus sp. VKM Ac-2987 TaxID=3004141 RepID=UPI0022AB5EBE|nr:hypothetical protein [Blastococcus sp. VKM Ac-2987]MCZ2857743.1 hypothetical protein [Blastococcus sp. VKM Ac-2987]
MSSDADPILQLGRDLANALDPSDVVGRWMSHHLAELIKRCEASPDDAELAVTTRDVVLKLWERKRGARFQTEPYGYLQAVLRAIARLDPDPTPWAYYRPFDNQGPNAEALTTYPLLQTACEIDREVGHLIRLAVAVAAREATSLEEPWVVAGMEIADTEEDRAARAVEQLVRRLQLRIGRDGPEALQADNHATAAPGSVQSTGPVPDDVGTEEPAAAGEDLDDLAERLESADALTVALGSAVIRCRRLIDQFAGLFEERSLGEGEGPTGLTESVPHGEGPGAPD